MAAVTAEGRVKLIHCLEIADISKPTPEELDGGTEFSAFLPTAGVGFNHQQNKASIAMIDKGKIAQAMGTQQVDADITFVFDDESNDPYEYFTNGLQGYLVRSVFGWTGVDGAPGDGDLCMVYKCESGDPQPQPTAQDEYQQFVVPFGASDWDVRAVVTAAA